jgi:hypothetical protein
MTMPDAAQLANVISLIALVVSVVALVRARRADEATRELQRKQEKLIDHEIGGHERRLAAKMRAEIRLQVVDNGKMVLRNVGVATASNVMFKATPLDERPSPFSKGEIAHRFPIAELAPGAECSLLMSQTFGTSDKLAAEWSWDNADGTPEQRTTALSLP